MCAYIYIDICVYVCVYFIIIFTITNNAYAIFAISELLSGSLVVNDEKHRVHLVELPCHIESQKTFDKFTYYKSADISQVRFRF